MKPEKEIIKSIKNTNSSLELIEKTGEVALDSLINDGLLKDIPILGTALSLLKAGNDLQAYLFTKKILSFLSEVETLSNEERENYFSSTPIEEQDKFGESLLLILDKIDDLLIAKMLGKAFALLVKGKLEKVFYDVYIHIIKQLNAPLIKGLHDVYANDACRVFYSLYTAQLASLGLIKKVTLGIQSDENRREFESSITTTDFGKYFYKAFIK